MIRRPQSFTSLLLLLILSLFVIDSAYAARCKAITKKGTQCKREAVAGSDYCWQHQSYAKGSQNEPQKKTGTSVKSETQSSTTVTSSGRKIYTGPRGGQYYYNSKGKKTYIRKKK